MDLLTAIYQTQNAIWPQSGKHIMAQYTDDYVVVYQAYRPEIGLFAAENQYFGGAYSYTRMSWIKPNFLWMMYRSGWGTKQGQEITLAIYLKRDYFDRILLNAYPSSNILGVPQEEWRDKLTSSNVRLQWDPDHDPFGTKLERRAIQLGLRNEFLDPFKGNGIVKIEDISDFVAEQHEHVLSSDLDQLITPSEKAYPVTSEIKRILAI